jgi:glycosyltransferase involved in cell wall biosynthesis
MLERPALTAPGLAHYSPEHPLLLVTDYPPETGGGGAVIFRSLLSPAEREKIVWATLSPTSLQVPGVVPLRRGSAARTGWLGRSLWLDSTVMAGALAEEVLDLAERRGARALWVLMHGAGVALAARLVRRATLPVHLTVHDDPAFGVALNSRRYLALVPWIERDFASAMRSAAGIDVISAGMADRYARRYGVRSVVVHRGMGEPVEPSPPYDKERLGLRIGVLGNTYTYNQLPILGRAVAQAAGRLGVPGRLLVVGRSHGERLKADLAGQAEVEITGHIAEAEAVRRLRECFLLYLNYPFSARRAVLRQTSFPTKLSTYLQATRPILIHAPAATSVAPLTEHQGYVAHWDTPRESDGASVLTRLWDDPRSFESFHAEADRVRTRYYDLEHNRRTLFDALDALVPPLGGVT